MQYCTQGDYGRASADQVNWDCGVQSSLQRPSTGLGKRFPPFLPPPPLARWDPGILGSLIHPGQGYTRASEMQRFHVYLGPGHTRCPSTPRPPYTPVYSGPGHTRISGMPASGVYPARPGIPGPWVYSSPSYTRARLTHVVAPVGAPRAGTRPTPAAAAPSAACAPAAPPWRRCQLIVYPQGGAAEERGRVEPEIVDVRSIPGRSLT